MMSSIFSVSTDYLLKDNENNEILSNEISAKTMNKDEVKVYLSTNKKIVLISHLQPFMYSLTNYFISAFST